MLRSKKYLRIVERKERQKRMFFRISPRLRLVRRLFIDWLLVVLVAVYLEFLKWMSVRSMPRVGPSGTEEHAPGILASHAADTVLRMLPIDPLPRTAPAVPRNWAPLLLVSVTDVEVRAVLSMVSCVLSIVIENRTYYDLGIVGEIHTYLVQATGMGPVGVRACIEDGIRALAPCAIILVGMAFGLQPDRQQIGDILLCRQVQDYDPQRWGIGPGQEVVIYGRGNRVAASEWLLDRFTAGKHRWPGSAQIQTGLLLSGSILVDHPEARDRLRQLAPEALGGEMEAATLCDIAQRHHVGWIVVKAISDRADGAKRQHEQEHQRLAAENATQFVFHVIQQPGFLPRA
jgi:nucleoside phosphorylase